MSDRAGPTCPPPKRCAIYARTADAPMTEAGLLTSGAQRDACVRYIHTRGDWHIVEERDDDLGTRGANLRRPALRRLLRAVDSHRVDVVLVSAAGRLTRGYIALATMLQRLGTVGAELASVAGGFWTGAPTGAWILGLLFRFLDLESATRAAPDGAGALGEPPKLAPSSRDSAQGDGPKGKP